MTGPFAAALVAHSWGWDELLFFGIPIVVALFGIRWVERRAARRYAETQAETPADGIDEQPGGSDRSAGIADEGSVPPLP